MTDRVSGGKGGASAQHAILLDDNPVSPPPSIIAGAEDHLNFAVL
jgi:hypothetical protein